MSWRVFLICFGRVLLSELLYWLVCEWMGEDSLRLF